jgi:hypothetical protein
MAKLPYKPRSCTESKYSELPISELLSKYHRNLNKSVELSVNSLPYYPRSRPPLPPAILASGLGLSSCLAISCDRISQVFGGDIATVTSAIWCPETYDFLFPRARRLAPKNL